MKKRINHWFALHVADYSPDDWTRAAEDCAHALGHDEWLDEEQHPVWEIALAWLPGF